MSPIKLTDLERSAQRREIVRMVIRVAATFVALFLVYYMLPARSRTGGVALLGLAVSILLFALIVVWLVRRIMRADFPGLRVIEVLALIIPLFLFLFATTYLAMSRGSIVSFSEPLSHTGALYFAITVISTVGFGDITPATDAARMVVGLQMVLDMVLIGAVVRVVIGAARSGFTHGPEPAQSDGAAGSSGSPETTGRD